MGGVFIIGLFKKATSSEFLRYIDAIMQHLNWDNLRYVLAVAQQGSIAAAARELGVNRSTVLRRIHAFEETLNFRIFQTSENGYLLHPEAEKMIESAQLVEKTIYDMQRQVEGRELKLVGDLGITTTDTFMLTLLWPHLANFSKKHPRINLHLQTSLQVVDLSRRDADIAIRPTNTPEPYLVGEQLTNLDFHVYGTEAFIDQSSSLWHDSAWIGFDSYLINSVPGQWLASKVSEDNIRIYCDSFVSARVACENGAGLALLPEVLGSTSETLQRVNSIETGVKVGLWILTHPDLIRSARVDAFIQYMIEVFSQSGEFA